MHFMGLTSNGGVHSSFEHIFALCDIAKEYDLKNVYLHCFMDGRDTDPRSGKGFIEQLTEHCDKTTGKIASIVGRYYAMDRDKRWDRVKEAYDLLVEGKGEQATDMVAAMQQSYDNDVTDEFIKPINNATVDGTIKPGDVVLGHSMGSYMLRKYITMYPENLWGAIIVGTGSMPDATMKLGMKLCRMFKTDRKSVV